MANSIHTARWISQIAEEGWEIHLFPSLDVGELHPELQGLVTVHHLGGGPVPLVSRAFRLMRKELIERRWPWYRAALLASSIRRVRPDIIHTMETQAAGYLTVQAKKRYEGEFPAWIHTVWGSDLFLFGRLSAHKKRISEVMESCDCFIGEGTRDIELARSFGFNGKVLGIMQATGGFDIEHCRRLTTPGPTSRRRLILLKGYQGWSGRSLVGLRALERAADILSGYRVAIYSATDDVRLAAELFCDTTGIPATALPRLSHEELLSLQGEARISISLGISDGVPNSLLEAMVMGAFPIQSWTACTDEWVENGKTGILVPPEDPEVVEQAIRRALTDDDLVDSAAEINYRMAAERLDQAILKPNTINLYNLVAQETIDKAGKDIPR